MSELCKLLRTAAGLSAFFAGCALALAVMIVIGAAGRVFDWPARALKRLGV